MTDAARHESSFVRADGYLHSGIRVGDGFPDARL